MFLQTEFSNLYVTIPNEFYIVIFPMDILERGLAAKNFAMLGLGDIVIPGNVKTFLNIVNS